MPRFAIYDTQANDCENFFSAIKREITAFAALDFTHVKSNEPPNVSDPLTVPA